MARIIMHIDLNAFFATAEELRNPSLKGQVLAIGSRGRSGIVSTANYEARKYGIHSGQPTFQAEALAKEAKRELIVLPPDFDYYRVMSASFFAYVKRFSTIIEQASIDEAYVDMTEPLSKEKDPVAYLRKMQEGLKKETGLSCSIGIAPTKWMAKMASDMKKPMGLVFLRRRDIPAILYPMPIESFWGIGKKTSPVLRSLGINTIGDLAAHLEGGDPALAKELGKYGEQVLLQIQGRSSDIVDTGPFDPKSVSCSETLMSDITSFAEAAPFLESLCEEVSRRAKEEKKVGTTISLTVKDTSFHLHQKSITLDTPTRSASTLHSVVCRLFKAYFDEKPGLSMRLLGVALGKLEDEVKQTVQMNFWNYGEYEAMDETKLLIAEFNRRYGKDSFKRASEAKKGED